ncbi:MAG: hypothetical protein ACYC3L_00565 [Gemmatimonadaceae bacterium]
MDRRTPPQHYWAALLRASFESPAAKLDDGQGRPGDPSAGDPPVEADDLVARVMADIDRHAVSAAATRNRIQMLRADAGAALQAAAIAEAKKGPESAGSADLPGDQGHRLDVRR